MTEKQVQRDVVKLYRKVGCEVVIFSQPRKTMQTPGIPDLRVYLVRKGLAWWHETKTPKGKQRLAQGDFQDRAEQCGETYVMGGLEAAIAQLRKVGV